MVSGNSKRNLIIGYITVFMDVLGYSLITPILPFLSNSMNATDFEEGLLYSGYCLTQAISLIWLVFSCIGLYIMGNGSDYYGRKIFFLLSLVGSCFGIVFFPFWLDRFHFPRIISNCMAIDFLEISHWFVCRVSHYYPSVSICFMWIFV